MTYHLDRDAWRFSGSMLVASQLHGSVTEIVKVLPASDGVALTSAVHPISLTEDALIEAIKIAVYDAQRVQWSNQQNSTDFTPSPYGKRFLGIDWGREPAEAVIQHPNGTVERLVGKNCGGGTRGAAPETA